MEGYFICTFESSVRIFRLDPLKERVHLFTKDIGSMAIAEVMNRSDIVNFVSGGSKPKNADNTVMVYKINTEEEKIHGYFTFPTPVLSVKVTNAWMATAHKREVNVSSYLNMFDHKHKFETRDNPLGLLVMTPGRSAAVDRTIICFPFTKCGEVRIVDLTNLDVSVSQPPSVIAAHTNELTCMSLNQEGTLLATASKHGTLIRVWDTIRKVKVAELRRGTDPATLYCINFSGDSDFLCCSSDKGTVHIFAIRDTTLNRKSTLSGMGLGDYVESQWALANFTVPHECKCICAFGPNSTVYAICYDGSYHKYLYTAEGTCNRVTYDMFPELCDHDEALFD